MGDLNTSSQQQTQRRNDDFNVAGGFKKIGQDAQKAYDQGAGALPDLSSQTQNAIGNMGKTAEQYHQGAMNNQYLSGETQSAQNLADMASGKYLQQGNPYYQKRLQDTINQGNSLIQSQFAGMGRYGSGANTAALAQNTNNTLLAGLENDYNRGLQAMMQANQQIDGANNAQIGARNAWLQGQGSADRGALAGGSVLDQFNQNKADAPFSRGQKLWDILNKIHSNGGTTSITSEEGNILNALLSVAGMVGSAAVGGKMGGIGG